MEVADALTFDLCHTSQCVLAGAFKACCMAGIGTDTFRIDEHLLVGAPCLLEQAREACQSFCLCVCRASGTRWQLLAAPIVVLLTGAAFSNPHALC